MAGFRTSEQTPFDIEMRFTMNKLLSCRFNMDTNRVEARFEDGTTLESGEILQGKHLQKSVSRKERVAYG